MAKKKKVHRRRSGQAISQQITEQCINSLRLRDFDEISYAEYQAMNYDDGRYLIKNHPYMTPYGTQGRGEWLIVSPEATGPLECKHQECSGSVDEKIPYVVERCKGLSRGFHMFLVFGGSYWIESTRGCAAVTWAKQQAKSIEIDRGITLIVCQTFEDFITKAKRLWK